MSKIIIERYNCQVELRQSFVINILDLLSPHFHIFIWILLQFILWVSKVKSHDLLRVFINFWGKPLLEQLFCRFIVMLMQLTATSEVELSIFRRFGKSNGQLPHPSLYIFDSERFNLLFVHWLQFERPLLFREDNFLCLCILTQRENWFGASCCCAGYHTLFLGWLRLMFEIPLHDRLIFQPQWVTLFIEHRHIR